MRALVIIAALVMAFSLSACFTIKSDDYKEAEKQVKIEQKATAEIDKIDAEIKRLQAIRARLIEGRTTEAE